MTSFHVTRSARLVLAHPRHREHRGVPHRGNPQRLDEQTKLETSGAFVCPPRLRSVSSAPRWLAHLLVANAACRRVSVALTDKPWLPTLCADRRNTISLNVSVDEGVVKHARKVARSLGKSLNQLIREYLHGLVAKGDAEADIAELRLLSVKGKGRSAGWRFDSDEIHARP